MKSKPVLIWGGVAGVLLSLVFYYYSSPIVPIHFNTKGIADAWASRETALILWIILYGVITLLFFYLPFLLKKIPAKYVNLPNRSYWLSSERKEDTFQNVTGFLHRFGFVILIYFFALQGLAFRALFLNPARINPLRLYMLFILFLLYTGFWLIRFYRFFLIKD